jgi:hypothetical protein
LVPDLAPLICLNPDLPNFRIFIITPEIKNPENPDSDKIKNLVNP